MSFLTESMFYQIQNSPETKQLLLDRRVMIDDEEYEFVIPDDIADELAAIKGVTGLGIGTTYWKVIINFSIEDNPSVLVEVQSFFRDRYNLSDSLLDFREDTGPIELH